MKDLKPLILNQRVIILIGAGGVGKTTTSIVTAIKAATLGKKVALISIDPAKRLAKALGIALGSELKKVNFPEHLSVSGELHAAMLDQKAVFDDMVKKHAPSPHIADKILRDPMYQAASGKLSGPLEHMALVKLQALTQDPHYDLIIVDTPPDSQALDFLARPNILANFFESNVILKILKPALALSKLGLGKVFSASEKLIGGITSVTGLAPLAKLGEFVLLMQNILVGFQRAGEDIAKTLRLPSTSFILVTTPTAASAHTALEFAKKLQEMNLTLSALIFNKSLSKNAKLDLQKDPGQIESILKIRANGEAKIMEYLKNAIQGPDGEHLVIVEQPESDEALSNLEVLFNLSLARDDK